MDYRRIDQQGGEQLHIDPLPLAVRQLNEEQLAEALGTFAAGSEIRERIEQGVPDAPPGTSYENEFRGPDPTADSTPGSGPSRS